MTKITPSIWCCYILPKKLLPKPKELSKNYTATCQGSFFIYNTYRYKGDISSAAPQGMTLSGNVDDKICLTKLKGG